MKRTSLVLLGLVILAAPLLVKAQLLYTNILLNADLSYTNINGTITISRGCAYKPGALTIPSEIGGVPVTSIADWAFDYGCGFVTSVTIPGSVTNIGVDAFASCRSLTNVVFSNGVTTSSISGRWPISRRLI